MNRVCRRFVAAFFAAVLGVCLASARADGAAKPAAAGDAAELAFRDFFVLPIGPRGLEPTPRLRSLDGRRVRIVGHMARQDAGLEPLPGVLILAPQPVLLGDEDERLADDLPAAVVYVHLAPAQQMRAVPHRPGPLALTGVLQLGAAAEADGRRSFVRLRLDEGASQALINPPLSNPEILHAR